MRRSGKKLPLPTGRIALLLTAAASMLMGVLASLVRASIPGPWAGLRPALPNLHGALMVFGFLGTAISLERAVAYRAGSPKHPRWAFTAPLFSVIANFLVAVTVLSPLPVEYTRILPGLSWTLSLIILSAVYVGVYARQHSFAVLIQLMGAVIGACSALLWTRLDSDILTPWWLMMLVLTIVGERLELAHVAFIHPVAKPGLVCVSAAILISLACSLIAPSWGYSLLGLCTLTLLVLMFLFDTARKTYRVPGVTGFMGISMLVAYFWGLCASLTWIVSNSGGLAGSSLWWDFAVHSLAVGFIMTMVVAHVCVIVPSIIHRSMPFHPILWLPLALFTLGLALRFIGTVRVAMPVWQAGDCLNALGMLALVASVITMLARSHRRPRIVSPSVTLRMKHDASRRRQSSASTTRQSATKLPSLHKSNTRLPNTTDQPALQRSQVLTWVVCTALVLSSLGLLIRPDFATTSAQASLAAPHASASASASSSSSSPSSSLGSTSTEQAGSSGTATPVTPTGHTTAVTISVEGMSFTPSTLAVPAGDSVTITFINTGNQIHDLVLSTGATSGRLTPGQKAQLHIPLVTSQIEGWCSLPGHRQMGMSLHIVVKGGAKRSTTSQKADDTNNNPSAGSDNTSSSLSSLISAAQLQQFAKKVPSYSANLKGYTAGNRETTTRRYTITISQGKQQITNELSRETWTFNSRQPGPVLRGKVGDHFIITVKNTTHMDHSIDFHAGADAVPNKVMRSIAPGKSLVYSFTATRWGIWMYHCSSVPMSMHIANGMFGAVIIEPAHELPAVDHEYVLVQSEQYLGGSGHSADATRIASMNPDIVAFNGRAFQYDAHPLTMKAKERVRIWVLNAGPNSPLSFHIVGTQFSTVFSEGHYSVKDDHQLNTTGSEANVRAHNTAAGANQSDNYDARENASEDATGSQALSLLPAQGGFVELTVPKRGDYPIVNHVMSLAERGAHGILRVE